MARVNWHGDEAKRRIEAELKRRLNAAALVVERRAKELISVPGLTMAFRTTNRKYKGEIKTRRKGSKIYGAAPSQPGEPPRKQTGHLRRSVTREVDGKRARVGTPVKYGRWLELGTRNMAARPWLRRALAESQAKIQEIFRRRMPGG